MINFYVSPTGNDDNPGTLAEPVKTIQKAQELVRLVEKIDDITVHLRAGTYQLTSKLLFREIDGGKDRFTVTYRGYFAEPVTISGGVPLTGWANWDADTWFIASTQRTRNLIVNGKPAKRGRYPNTGVLKLKHWYWPEQTVQVAGPPNAERVILVKTSDLPAVFPVDGSTEMAVYRQWATARMTVIAREDIQAYGDVYTKLTLEAIATQNAFGTENPPKFPGGPCFFEGNFADQPGEYFDWAAGGLIFYKPKAGETLANTTFLRPGLTTLIDIKNCVNLYFESLTFSETEWLTPNQYGWVGQVGNLGTVPAPDDAPIVQYLSPGAIELEFAKNIRFKNCKIQNCAANGIALYSGCQHIEISDSTIEEVGYTGIVPYGKTRYYKDGEAWVSQLEYNMTDLEKSKYLRVLNNTIRRCGNQYSGGCGVWCGFLESSLFQNNTFEDIPHAGVSLGWGFSATSDAQSRNVVRRNKFVRMMTAMSDGGAIYQSGKSSNARIEENLITDMSPLPEHPVPFVVGVYLDAGSAEVTVSRNVFQRITGQGAQNIYIAATATGAVEFDNDQQYADVIANAGRQ